VTRPQLYHLKPFPPSRGCVFHLWETLADQHLDDLEVVFAQVVEFATENFSSVAITEIESTMIAMPI
jgi:hypothetical protein